jgi:glyoxylase-like metal-dependent hydrolase (beta-lactamase superfamily II)
MMLFKECNIDRDNTTQWQIGKVKITRIVELVVSGNNAFVLPDAENEKCLPLNWMKPYFMNDDGDLIFSVHALIIDTGEKRIMVDTCIGNDKQLAVPDWDKMQTTFLSDLEDAGYPHDSVDIVLCTHLHVDHVGWNTMLVDGQWIPTFKNARYLFAKEEWVHWDTHEDEIEIGPVMQQSVRPVVDAGLMDLVDCEYQVCNEIKLVPTPGHTPGHVSVHITSEGKEALITGDFVHHPVQLSQPHWCSIADDDQAKGLETRNKMFSKYVDSDVLIIGTHFPTPTAGYIKHLNDGENYWLDVNI